MIVENNSLEFTWHFLSGNQQLKRIIESYDRSNLEGDRNKSAAAVSSFANHTILTKPEMTWIHMFSSIWPFSAMIIFIISFVSTNLVTQIELECKPPPRISSQSVHFTCQILESRSTNYSLRNQLMCWNLTLLKKVIRHLIQICTKIVWIHLWPQPNLSTKFCGNTSCSFLEVLLNNKASDNTV